ncbi:binding-protein-dependent transport systems inner membrane component [Candidatus Vecturithrix granuli]|uniref:Binding-protein-dependent transport systems inner membrane component n=1 Tax=Vecturithrix granuli TaxID=1499967 RepID=A0A081BV05_VECG1|nr:binding-protein-dependent transport systems inner membrane component [Candidatus Vecturithrix granuli]
MAVQAAIHPSERVAIVSEATPPRRRFHSECLHAILLVVPSLVAVAIFVYLFIGMTFYFSISNWRSLKRDLSIREPFYQTYVEMFSMPRFQTDLRNTLVFTVLFMVMAIGLGLILAIFLDRNVKGSAIFRNIYLFPYALSFVVTGVAWRWIFNPETGINLFFNIFGVNKLLTFLGFEAIKPGWITDPSIWFNINGALATVWPAAADFQVKLGIPAALIPVAIAATWQLSGFVMATYLGGMAAIPESVHEAARIDGASEWQIYWHVIIPMLKPVTISVAVILLHVSLKIFDLVFTMSGVGPGFATDVPAIFVFEMTFKATRYNLGAAASVVMLVLAGVVMIPYLLRSLRKED